MTAVTTDAALVERAIEGDGEAFTRLYDLYLDQVYRYVRYRTRDPAEAEDLTQEVFLRAWRAIRTYRQGERPLVAWLYAIAHNVVVDHLRRRGRAPAESLDVQRWEMGKADSALDEVLGQDAMRRLLERLPPEWQQVVVLRFVEGWDHTQVAVAMGRHPGAVRVIQHRALRRLRDLLEKERTQR